MKVEISNPPATRTATRPTSTTPPAMRRKIRAILARSSGRTGLGTCAPASPR
ncbi:Uncharacterised protein [Mycobacteroides abscessus]|nr:Uncharacterised protein [Mycobacteroides abscessus]